METAALYQCSVIGIGNPQRGDDGVGSLLAAELTHVERVLFIDAWLAAEAAGPTPFHRLDPAQLRATLPEARGLLQQWLQQA
ncbi:MAG: hypothetical protein AAFX65_05805 [Cyanobacteria bacterium J06638_7]